MAAKSEKTTPVKPAEITFTCKFCGESKPLQDLIVIKHFYPQMSACKACAQAKKINEPAVEESQETEK
jgi:transcription elongation factor Elf1